MTEPLHTSSNGAAEEGANSAFASEKALTPSKRLQRFDSLHMEAGKIPGGQSHVAKVCSSLALLQSDNNLHFLTGNITASTFLNSCYCMHFS